MNTSSFLTLATVTTLLTQSLLAGPLESPSIPALINYQGFVADSSDQALGSPAENFDVEFRLYDSGTNGNVLWGESQTVTISEGRFSVLLGNGGAIDSTTPRDDLDSLFGPGGTMADAPSVFLGLTVNSVGGTGAAEFSPRQQIVANPFSLRAKSADVAQMALNVADGSLESTSFAAASVTGGSGGAIASNTITSTNLANNSVDATKIAANAVGNSEMSNDAIGSAEIINHSITASDLANNSVGTAEIANGAVTAVKLASGSVGGDKIIPGSLIPSNTNYIGLSNERIDLHVPGSSTPSFEVRDDDNSFMFYFGGSNITHFFFDSSSYFSIKRRIGDGGYARLANNGSWSQGSDIRLKRDIVPATSLLDKTLSLEPVFYRFRTESSDSQLHLGVIAQNVNELFPSLVEKGDTWSVNYAGLSVAAIGAVQELHGKLGERDTMIQALEAKNSDLEARLKRLEQVVGGFASNE